MFAVVSEEFSDSASGVGSNELKWGSLRSGGSNDDGVLHGVVGLEDLDQVGDGGSLLSDGNVDAV